MFISTLVAREKPPTFTELARILLQEEERMKTFDLDVRSSYLELLEKGKKPYRGKPSDRSKGGKFQAKQKGIASSKFESNAKKNDECFYCGKLGHHAKDYYKRKAHEWKFCE